MIAVLGFSFTMIYFVRLSYLRNLGKTIGVRAVALIGGGLLGLFAGLIAFGTLLLLGLFIIGERML